MPVAFGGLCAADSDAGLEKVGRAVLGLKERLGRTAGGEALCAFVYDLDWLRSWVAEMAGHLPERCRLYYAVKANPDEKILRVLRPLVTGFEVASGGEVRKVRAVSGDCPILFGGPGKTDGEIRESILSRVSHVHAESLHELRRIEAVAASLGARARVLLRVNLRESLPSATLRMSGVPTQFGIDEGELPEVIAAVGEMRHVDCEGFHFHSISNHLDAASHAELVRLYIRKARRWAAESGFPIRILNAGGGIGINYAEGGSQFDWPGFSRRLASVVEAELPSAWEIRFECGRYLVAGCGFYAAEVLDLKKNHEAWFAIVRGGTHHFRLPASWQHSHPFLILPDEAWPYGFPRPALRDGKISVCGQLCTPKDVLARDVGVRELRVGDFVLFRLAGAYGWTISHRDFLSHPHPHHLYLEAESGLA